MLQDLVAASFALADWKQPVRTCKLTDTPSKITYSISFTIDCLVAHGYSPVSCACILLSSFALLLSSSATPLPMSPRIVPPSASHSTRQGCKNDSGTRNGVSGL